MSSALSLRYVLSSILFLIVVSLPSQTIAAQPPAAAIESESAPSPEVRKTKVPVVLAKSASHPAATTLDVAPTKPDTIKRLADEIRLYPNVGVHEKNMVATVDPQATDAGLNAIRIGGNAIDAAIAACLTLGVVDGYNSGIGGGCFILIHTADGKLHAIDGRETAPAAACPDFYQDDLTGEVKPEESRLGPKAVAIPGALLAFEEAVNRFGNLTLTDLILPAADIAEEGFAVSDVYYRRQVKVLDELRRFPETVRVLLTPEGQPLPPGHVLKQPDLAETYRNIAACGTEWFYECDFAEDVVSWMSKNGGQITRDDFANYRTVTREPLRSNYRGYDVVGFPLPSSGGLHVAQILNMLESFPLANIYQEDPVQAIHVVAEAMKLAFADRAYWPGDPAFVNVPRSLISQEYANSQADRIDCENCTNVASHGQPPNPEDAFVDRHTTHISAADEQGNWVAITSTINTSFGSKIIVPGTGVILNNEMDDFSLAPGIPNHFGLVGNKNNCVEAGKRPLSSMSPTIVLKDGQPILTVGAAGGPKIITQVLWSLINTIDFGMTPGQIMSQPRIHHQWSPDYLRVESTLPMDTRNRLHEFGHELFIAESNEVGVCQMIVFDRDSGKFIGAHDARVPGKAAGTNIETTSGR